MTVKAKNQNKSQKILLSCDNVTTAYIVSVLLFFTPYVIAHSHIVVLAFLPFALVLPFVVLPVVYAAVHKHSPLIFGRYHLAMPLTAFAAAVFNVFMWSATGPDAKNSIAVVMSFALLVESLVIYRYCSFSVRVRLIGSATPKTNVWGLMFSLFGAGATLGALYGFYKYDAQTMFLNTAYITSAICIIAALVQYFATYSAIPRLGGRRQQTYKGAFRTFFVGLDLRTYLSTLFTDAAFFTAGAVGVYFTYKAFGPNAAEYTGVSFIAAFAIAFTLAEIYVKRRRAALSVAIWIMLFVGPTLMALSLPEAMSGVKELMYISGAIISGSGGAFAVRQTGLRFVTIKKHVTSGNVYAFIELALCASAAVAAAVVAGVSAVMYFTDISTSTVFMFGLGFAAALAVVGLALSHTGKPRPEPTELVSEPSEPTENIEQPEREQAAETLDTITLTDERSTNTL